MNASSVAAPPRSRPGTLAVPMSWRIGQGVVIALIILMALWYNTAAGRGPGRPEARTAFDQVGFALLIGLTWLTTPNAGVIAMNTLQTTVRRRWLQSLLAISIILLGCSSLFVGLQPGEESKFLRDFGLGFIIMMTLLMAIFVGTTLVPPDIERRTILTILSKPVNRNEFIAGKFLGLCATLALALGLLGVIFIVAYATYQSRQMGWNVAWAPDMARQYGGLGFELRNLLSALVLHGGQLVVMAALSLTLSLIVSPITGIVFCFLAYFGGQMSSYWEQLGSGARTANETAPGLSRGMQGVVSVVYYALPRLDRFDVRERVINDDLVGFAYVWKAWNGGLIYSGVLLLIAVLVFSDREF